MSNIKLPIYSPGSRIYGAHALVNGMSMVSSLDQQLAIWTAKKTSVLGVPTW